MLGDLTGRFSRMKEATSAQQTTTKKHKLDEYLSGGVNLCREEDGLQFGDLMKQENINHSIIMGGFLCWKDIVNCLCVCKAWRQIIDCPAAYDMLFHNMLKSLDSEYPVGVYCGKGNKKFQVGNADLNTIKEFLSFSLIEMEWYSLSGFGHEKTRATTKFLDFLSINSDHDIKSIKNGMKISIPKDLQSEDPWCELTSPSWDHSALNDFAIFMAFQSRFQYSFSFIGIAFMKGNFYKVHSKSRDVTNYFLEGQFEREVKDEIPIYGKCRAKSCREAHINAVSEFRTIHVEDNFLNDPFLTLPPRSTDPETESDFNSYLRRMLFNIWKSGFLYHAPVRDYMFQLLFLLSNGQLRDYHTFHFSDECRNSDENVTKTVENIMSSKEDDSETLYSYLNMKMPCSGYSRGRSDNYFFVALTLKQSINFLDECEFEFVIYRYFSYSVRGIALS